MSIDKTVRVTEIQRFCMHDGAGLRTTVFLKGCPLRCAWCHNPETQSSGSELLFYPAKCIGCASCAAVCPNGAHILDTGHTLLREMCTACGACAENCPTGALDISGREMTVREILETVKKDIAFYGERGGITLSGGEPFMQGEGALALLAACKETGISTAVETSGYAERRVILAAAPLVDEFLFDIKDTNDERHKLYTGGSLDVILDNLFALSELGARIRMRCILVNGVNTVPEHYAALARIAERIKNLEGAQLIPYHAYGGTKSVFIGRADSGRVDWIPTDEQLAEAKEAFRSHGVRVI